ncbi:hypothetical protein XH93_31415 [Bradyrhizobium sp. CCBAU 51753]|nr:hypothetical protein XH93_31415 [Bradyrhizobium sp. CCBAU 51753]
MRGEAGLHRRCNPGEGDSPRVHLSPVSRRLPLTPTLSARALLVAAPQPGRGGETVVPCLRAWTTKPRTHFASPRLRGEAGLHRQMQSG